MAVTFCINGYSDSRSKEGLKWYQLGKKEELAKRDKKAKEYYKKACDFKNEIGCYNSAILAGSLKDKRDFYLLSCHYKYSKACYNAGELEEKEGWNSKFANSLSLFPTVSEDD